MIDIVDIPPFVLLEIKLEALTENFSDFTKQHIFLLFYLILHSQLPSVLMPIQEFTDSFTPIFIKHSQEGTSGETRTQLSYHRPFVKSQYFCTHRFEVPVLHTRNCSE